VDCKRTGHLVIGTPHQCAGWEWVISRLAVEGADGVCMIDERDTASLLNVPAVDSVATPAVELFPRVLTKSRQSFYFLVLLTHNNKTDFNGHG